MTEPPQEPTKYVHGGIELDRLKRKVTVDGIAVDVTMREFGLLELLLGLRGQVLTRERIAATIWERETNLETNLIDVYILRLRKKLAVGSDQNPRIHTVRGVGYMLD